MAITLEQAEQIRRALLDVCRAEMRESREKLYSLGAQFGAASLLIKHFGSEEKTRKVGLAAQLHFLFYSSVPDEARRRRFALEWAKLHIKPGLEFTQELQEIIPLIEADCITKGVYPYAASAS